MSDDIPKGHLAYEYVIYESHSVSKGGFLPDFERGAHACWYYCVCAHQNLQSSDDGATYDGEQDTWPALNNIARSVCTLYQLESPEDFLKFMPVVLKECDRVGRLWDPRVLNPWLHQFHNLMS